MAVKHRLRRVARAQNTTADGTTFGYVFVGSGGLFFEWRYDPALSTRDRVAQVVATLDEDTIDQPTGRWSYQSVGRALRHHIASHGLYRLTAGQTSSGD